MMELIKKYPPKATSPFEIPPETEPSIGLSSRKLDMAAVNPNWLRPMSGKNDTGLRTKILRFDCENFPWLMINGAPLYIYPKLIHQFRSRSNAVLKDGELDRLVNATG